MWTDKLGVSVCHLALPFVLFHRAGPGERSGGYWNFLLLLIVAILHRCRYHCRLSCRLLRAYCGTLRRSRGQSDPLWTRPFIGIPKAALLPLLWR